MAPPLLSLLLLLLALALAPAAPQGSASYRLPLEARPLAYSLSLLPHLQEEDPARRFTFEGTARIEVEALRPERQITLHASDMTVRSAAVNGVPVARVELEEKREFLTLKLAAPLDPGRRYNLTLNYTGNLRDDLAGFYRSSYRTAEGETRWLATTQFEATAARRAFPCFDEPALKATFDIRIAPPAGLHAVSNMPLVAVSQPDPQAEGRYWYHFARSVPMSSYLVAFIVSDFGYLESGSFRILAKAHQLDTARYPLSVSPRILQVMANLTGVEYQLPKMDQVAVPDFAAGAMENWGLVTYREGYLLLTEDTPARRKSSASVIAHEFAHQWFGNLVSPLWWQFTWLNEGFASFFEYVDTNKVEPQWDLLYEMVVGMQHGIMRSDARPSSHPITRPVETPGEISSSFDSITYSKGGSLNKMVQHFLGEKTFYKGLNLYLKSRSYGAAEPDQLFAGWQAAAEASGALPSDLTVKQIMDTWTLQAGYPLLTVTRDYAAGSATVTQERFVTSGSADGSRWFVPVSYTTGAEAEFADTRPREWLRPDQPSLTLRNIPADTWLVLNLQDAGYYRVNYDPENWRRLLAAVDQPDHGGIHPLSVAQILDDARELGAAGLVPAELGLRALRSLRWDQSPAAWRPALRQLERLHRQIGASEDQLLLQAAARPLLSGALAATDPRMRSDERAALARPELLRAACQLEDAACPAAAADAPAEARAAAWCAAVRAGGRPEWQRALASYTAADSAPVRRDALAALGCSWDSELARELLSLAADRAAAVQLRPEDRAAALLALCAPAAAPHSCELALKFARTNLLQLAELLGEPEDAVWLLRRLAEHVRTAEQLALLRAAAAAAQRAWPLEPLEDGLEAALQAAEAGERWARTDGAPVLAWLRAEARSGGA